MLGNTTQDIHCVPADLHFYLQHKQEGKTNRRATIYGKLRLLSNHHRHRRHNNNGEGRGKEVSRAGQQAPGRHWRRGVMVGSGEVVTPKKIPQLTPLAGSLTLPRPLPPTHVDLLPPGHHLHPTLLIKRIGRLRTTLVRSLSICEAFGRENRYN